MGGILYKLQKSADAEPLLLIGATGLLQRKEKIPFAQKPRVREALERLVRLYDATEHPDQAAEWKAKLADFDQAAAERKSVVAPKESSK